MAPYFNNITEQLIRFYKTQYLFIVKYQVFMVYIYRSLFVYYILYNNINITFKTVFELISYMYRWNNLDRCLILASGSPRRKEILAKMGFTFSVLKPDIQNEDEYIQSDRIEESIQELAYAKAESVSGQHESSLIFGSDTIVVIDNRIIGKPTGYDDAKSMLQCLSGKEHKVYSSIALICANIHFKQTAVACTDVYFREIPEIEIDEYLSAGEYIDKAGAYAIQGKAMTFVNKINGCFYNVMGLPVSETIDIFKAYFDFLKGSE